MAAQDIGIVGGGEGYNRTFVSLLRHVAPVFAVNVVSNDAMESCEGVTSPRRCHSREGGSPD